MFHMTNFKLVLHICIVNAMIFIKKKTNINKLVQDQFLQIVKDNQYDKFGYVGKIMLHSEILSPLNFNVI